jgi:hypothetical protein
MSHTSDVMSSSVHSGFDAHHLQARSRRATQADGASLLASGIFWMAGICCAGVCLALIVGIARLL